MKKVTMFLAATLTIALLPSVVSAKGMSLAEYESKKRKGLLSEDDYVSYGGRPSSNDYSVQEGYIYVINPDYSGSYVRDEKYFEIKSAVERRNQSEYGIPVIDHFNIPIDISYSDNDHRCVSVYFIWKEKNSKDFVRKNIIEISDDLAAYLADEFDYVTDIFVFWSVPHLDSSGFSTKYSYKNINHRAAIIDSVGRFSR